MPVAEGGMGGQMQAPLMPEVDRSDPFQRGIRFRDTIDQRPARPVRRGSLRHHPQVAHRNGGAGDHRLRTCVRLLVSDHTDRL